MKIYYAIHQYFPDYYTGTEQYLLNIATMMQKFGHEIKIFTYLPNFDKEMEKIGAGLYFKKYTYKNHEVVAIHFIKDKNNFLSFNFKNDFLINFFKSELKKNPPNILHVVHPMRIGSIFLAAKLLKIKTVLTLTDYWLLCPRGILKRSDNSLCLFPKKGINCKKFCYQFLPKNQLIERFNDSKFMYENSDFIIFSNEFTKKIFLTNNFFNKNIAIIPHGINVLGNTKTNKNKKKHFNFASLGTILPHKGVDLLIQAFKKIPIDKIKLKIYGNPRIDENYFNYLKKLIGKDKRIIFEGEYRSNDLQNLLSEIDLVVQPSTWFETYPLVCVNSLNYGVPIIVPKPSGAAILVKEKINGFTYEINNVNSLKETLLKAYKKNLKYNSNIKYDHSIEEEAFETEKIYLKVLNNS
ncbi:MAG: glycosyltransferase [Microgenomates group bacterium]|nr:glycosyltransferase [Microgenomates group bacterium]